MSNAKITLCKSGQVSAIVTVSSVNSACNQAVNPALLTNVSTGLINLAILSYTPRFLVQNHLPVLDLTQTQKHLKLSYILECSTLIRCFLFFLHVYVSVVCMHLYVCMLMGAQVCVPVCVGQRLMQVFFNRSLLYFPEAGYFAEPKAHSFG